MTSAKTPIEVIYRDPHIVIVTKPDGIPSQRTLDYSVIPFDQLVKIHFPSASLIHRLDAAASGLMVFGLSKEGNRMLTESLRRHQWVKIYLFRFHQTGANGPRLANRWLRWERLIEPKPDSRGRSVVSLKQGQAALTIGHIIAPDLMLAAPITGRRHQLRLMASNLSIPIEGDRLYGGQTSIRLHLHACALQVPNLGKREGIRVFSRPEFTSDLEWEQCKMFLDGHMSVFSEPQRPHFFQSV